MNGGCRDYLEEPGRNVGRGRENGLITSHNTIPQGFVRGFNAMPNRREFDGDSFEREFRRGVVPLAEASGG